MMEIRARGLLAGSRSEVEEIMDEGLLILSILRAWGWRSGSPTY